MPGAHLVKGVTVATRLWTNAVTNIFSSQLFFSDVVHILIYLIKMWFHFVLPRGGVVPDSFLPLAAGLEEWPATIVYSVLTRRTLSVPCS